MAKQGYEKKQTIKITGTLDKRVDTGELIITVVDKDSVVEYELEDIISDMMGTMVTFSNEETL